MRRVISFLLSAIGLATVIFAVATFVMLPAPADTPEPPIELPFGAHELTATVGWEDDPPPGLVAASSMDTAAGRPLRVLMVSMGGEYAAYGAGMLVASAEQKGWLDFDIITGVSAGGLLATFAFTRELQPDVVTRRVASIAAAVEAGSTGSAFIDAWRILLGWGTTVASSLEAVIGDMITEELVAKIAHEHRSGRRLLIASTDLTSGSAVVWDIGRIAASDLQDRVHLVRTAILASMSIPALFEPRLVRVSNGTTWHVDGGVMHPFFLAGMAATIAANRPGVELSFLMNGKLRDPITVSDLTARPDLVLARVAKLQTHAQWRNTLQLLMLQSILQGFTVRIAAIPDDISIPPVGTDFKASTITSLFQQGLKRSEEAFATPQGNDAIWRRLTADSVGMGEIVAQVQRTPGPSTEARGNVRAPETVRATPTLPSSQGEEGAALSAR